MFTWQNAEKTRRIRQQTWLKSCLTWKCIKIACQILKWVWVKVTVTAVVAKEEKRRNNVDHQLASLQIMIIYWQKHQISIN